MTVRELLEWLAQLPQDEEVRWERRAGGTITLMIHDPEDPHDDYESTPLIAK